MADVTTPKEKKVKSKKVKRTAEKAEDLPEAKAAKVVVEDKKVEEAAPVVEEKKEETPVAPVEEKKEEAPKEEKVEEAPKVEEKVEEKPKDVESDAAEDTRPRITEKVHFVGVDSTINTVVHADEPILSSLALGNLLAGVRGNTGVKSGRYYYEAKIIETAHHHQQEHGQNRGGRYEFRIGFSTSSSHLLGGAEGNFIFNVVAGSYCAGAAAPSTYNKRARLHEQVGVLLNRDPTSEQKETISLFINGARVTEPHALPEGTEALFPHIIYRGCSVGVHFGPKPYKALEFTTRTLADASKEDVVASTVKPVDQGEVIFPIGFDCDEYIKEFSAKHPEYTVLTPETMKDWMTRSNAQANSGGKQLACCEDGGKIIGNLQRRRKYIVKYSDTNMVHERQQLCTRFTNCKKIAHVMLSETTKHVQNFEKVALPEESEGFDHIEWIKSKEECEKALEAWKADCKLRSKVDNLKTGTLYKEKIAEFKKLVEEKKKDKEAYAEWTEEDYMLCTLRAEIHFLIHAFKTDVDDEARLSFSTMHFGHYYKLYNTRPFDMQSFNLQKIENALDYISDMLTIDEKTLMFSKLDKDVELVKFFELAEAARADRQDRLDAGDENSALKFTARKNKPHHHSNAGQRPKGAITQKPVMSGTMKPVNIGAHQHQSATQKMRQIPQNKRPAGQNWNQSAFKRR